MGEIRVKRIALLSLLAWGLCLEAGTIRLINDSPYKLRAVIRARDNSYLGEVVVNPQSQNSWNDGFQGLPGSLENVRSQTPYRVLWYCLDGSSFSTCATVSTGTTVTSTYCQGARQCRSKELKQGEGGNVEPASPLPIPIPPPQTQQAPPPPSPQNQSQTRRGAQQQPKRDLEFPPEYPAVQHEYDTPQVIYPSEQQ
jgi:hypothetical protein